MQAEPDDNLVLQTIEASGGASGDDICTHLKALWLKGGSPALGKVQGASGGSLRSPGSTSAICARWKMHA
jgi:hypothetical protein